MTTWEVTGQIADWADDAGRLTLNLNDPSHGVRVQLPHVDTEPQLRLFIASLCQDASSTPPVEERVCLSGSSVRATFPSSRTDPIEHHFTWTAILPEAGRVGVDTIVSARTEVLEVPGRQDVGSHVGKVAEVLLPKSLDSDPDLTWAAVPRNETELSLDPAFPCALFRLADQEISYLEMLFPADHHSSRIVAQTDSEDLRLDHRLFFCSLEKGVILRARLRGVVLPRENDEHAAAACLKEFFSADPPLGR